MITVYKVDSSATAPVPVRCEVFGYPNKDEDGNTMDEDSHFLTEEEAWGKLLGRLQGRLSLRSGNLRHLRSHVEEATQKVADTALLLTEAQERFEQWQREQVPREGE